MTLKEIAARAGVHISTVSRIINSPDDSFASRDVRERVWAIVKETGYVPNPSAQALRQKRAPGASHRIGSLACILGRTKTLEDNPFFAHVARAVEQHALSMGYAVEVSYSVLDSETPPSITKSETRALGAVVLGRFGNERTARLLEGQYKNLVFVSRNPIAASWDQVICDGYEATKLALEHLVSFGHRRVGYIGETKNEVRYTAYLDAVRQYGFENAPGLIAVCDQNSAEGGYHGADVLLQKASPPPTAVFCASDVAAIAAMRRFREAGLKLPAQLSIISIDNIELSGYVSPMLTTVGMPTVEMGNVAVQTLISRINKLHRLPQKIYLPNKLAMRESVINLNEGMYI